MNSNQSNKRKHRRRSRKSLPISENNRPVPPVLPLKEVEEEVTSFRCELDPTEFSNHSLTNLREEFDSDVSYHQSDISGEPDQWETTECSQRLWLQRESLFKDSVEDLTSSFQCDVSCIDNKKNRGTFSPKSLKYPVHENPCDMSSSKTKKSVSFSHSPDKSLNNVSLALQRDFTDLTDCDSKKDCLDIKQGDYKGKENKKASYCTSTPCKRATPDLINISFERSIQILDSGDEKLTNIENNLDEMEGDVQKLNHLSKMRSERNQSLQDTLEKFRVSSLAGKELTDSKTESFTHSIYQNENRYDVSGSGEVLKTPLYYVSWEGDVKEEIENLKTEIDDLKSRIGFMEDVSEANLNKKIEDSRTGALPERETTDSCVQCVTKDGAQDFSEKKVDMNLNSNKVQVDFKMPMNPHRVSLNRRRSSPEVRGGERYRVRPTNFLATIENPAISAAVAIAKCNLWRTIKIGLALPLTIMALGSVNFFLEPNCCDYFYSVSYSPYLEYRYGAPPI